MSKALGRVVANLFTNNKEKDRIRTLMEIESLNKGVFLKYGILCPSLNDIGKKPSYAPHYSRVSQPPVIPQNRFLNPEPSPSNLRKPSYKTLVLEKLIEKFLEGKYKDFFTVYQYAVSTYIAKKHKNLDTLLRKVKYKKDSPDSETLLNLIIKNASQYKVSTEAIKDLYELWIFDRVKKIDDYLMVALDLDESAQEDDVIKIFEFPDGLPSQFSKTNERLHRDSQRDLINFLGFPNTSSIKRYLKGEFLKSLKLRKKTKPSKAKPSKGRPTTGQQLQDVYKFFVFRNTVYYYHVVSLSMDETKGLGDFSDIFGPSFEMLAFKTYGAKLKKEKYNATFLRDLFNKDPEIKNRIAKQKKVMKDGSSKYTLAIETFNSHLMCWKNVKNDLKKWPQKEKEERDNIANVIFSIGTITNSIWPIIIAVKKVPDLKTYFAELLEAANKYPREDSVDEGLQASDTIKEKTNLAKKINQKQKKPPSASILVENLKKELIEFGGKKELDWLTKNVINKIFKIWNRKILLEGKDSKILIREIKSFRLGTLDKLKHYIDHHQNKIKTRKKIEKLESNLSTDTNLRRQEKKELKGLKINLAVNEDALDEIEDYFSEYQHSVVDQTNDAPDPGSSKNQDIKNLETINKQSENKTTKKKKSEIKGGAKVQPSKLNAPKSSTAEKGLSPAIIGSSPEKIAQQFLDKTISESYRNKESQLNLFWSLINEGRSNYAYWFVKSLDDCSIRHKDTPSPSLVKCFIFADQIVNQNSLTTSEYDEAIKYLKEEELNNLIENNAESPHGMRYFIAASMIQPCFYVPTLPSLYLRYINSGFPDWICEFLNGIATICKKPVDFSLILSNKSSELLNPRLLDNVRKEIVRIKNRPHEEGWKHWKPVAKKLINRDPFKSIIKAIEKNEEDKFKEVDRECGKYESEESKNSLLDKTQKEIDAEHKSSHHRRKKIDGKEKRNEFIKYFDDLLAQAKIWIEICKYKKLQLFYPEKNRLEEHVNSLRTQIPIIRGKLRKMGRGNYISSHAGVNALEKRLEVLENVINAKGPRDNDFMRWFQFPESLERIQYQKDKPSLAVRIANICISKFDFNHELDESIKSGEFPRSIQILEELQTSESSLNLDKYGSKINERITYFVKEFNDKFTQIEGELREANMQNIVKEYDYPSMTLDLEIIQEEVHSNQYPDFISVQEQLDKINKKLTNLKTKRTKELKSEYNVIIKKYDPPKQWIQDVKTAFETNKIYVAEEMINSFQESLDSKEPYKHGIEPDHSLFLDFIAGEKDIYKFFYKKKPGKELNNNIKSNKECGPLKFPKPEKDTINALKGWNGLNGHHGKGKLSKSEESHLLCVFESLGFSDVRIKNNQVLNKCLLIDTQIDMVIGISPLPHFGSLSEGKYITVFWWSKSLVDVLFNLEKSKIDYHAQPVILFLFDDLSPDERIEFWQYCHEHEIKILFIDRIIFLYLLSLQDSTTQSRLHKTFETLLPFSFNNPYEEEGPPPPKEMIFGRKKEVRSVLDPRGAAMLFGGRQLGKSTILKKAQEKFNNPELEKYGLAGEKLDENLKDLKGTKKNQKVSEEFWNNMGKAFESAGLLPKSLNHTSQNIRDLLLNNKNIKVLITLDEVDTFLDLDHQNDFRICSYLRDLTQTTNHRFKVVMAGLADVQRYARSPNFPLNQLGGNLPIGIMSTQDALTLIQKPLKNLGYSIDNPAAYKILAYTNRHPGLIQVFCHNLVNIISKKIINKEIQEFGYTIKLIDVENVYKDKTVQNFIISRFRYTLNLDPSWATLTYGLCIFEKEKEEFSVGEAKEIGEYFWSKGFSSKSLTIINIILHEMVSLGVLIRSGNMYRLRSHNVKHLLGSQKEMEDELNRVVQDFGEKGQAYRNRSFKINGVKHFSSLTLADEMVLLGYSEDEDKSLNRNYTVTSVFGSEALGFGDLQNALGTLQEFEGNTKSYTKQLIKEKVTFDSYAKEIKTKLTGQKKVPFILIIEMPKSPTGPEIYTQILNFLAGLRRLKRPENTRIICLFGPEATWKWIGKKNYISDQHENATLFLNRWERSNIKNVLTTLGFNANKSNVNLMVERTNGWFSLLFKFLKINPRDVRELSKLKELNRVLPKNPNQKYCRNQLEKKGLFDLSFMHLILKGLIDNEIDNEICCENIELVSEEIIDQHPEFDPSFFSDSERILRWFKLMGILEPVSNEKQPDCYKIENLTKLFISELNKQPVNN